VSGSVERWEALQSPREGGDGVSVRRVGPEDWASWRDLRLAALSDAPNAFGSTYDGQRAKTEADWRDRLDPRNGLTAIASLDGGPAGMIGGYVTEPGVVELISMWVARTARGRGVGDALVAEVVRWAEEQPARDVRLWVTRGNEAAERLYARHGFVRTGDVQPLPSDPCKDEIAMRLRLRR